MSHPRATSRGRLWCVQSRSGCRRPSLILPLWQAVRSILASGLLQFRRMAFACPPDWATGWSRYRAWLVDLDGTLYAAKPVKVAMAAELALRNWRAAWVIKRFRVEHERLRSEGPSGLANPYREQLERTANVCAMSVESVEALVDQWMLQRPAKWIRLFRRRWLIEEINKFRGKGGLVGIVSDYPVRGKLHALSMAHIVNVIVANGDSRAPYRLKPAPDGYRAAAASLGVSSGECLVIGDRTDADGQAAKLAGMAFAHVLGSQPLD